MPCIPSTKTYVCVYIRSEKMAKTERFTFWIVVKNKELLERAAKFSNGNSMGKILNSLIEQKLSDPIKVLKSERDKLVKKINYINKQLTELEK